MATPLGPRIIPVSYSLHGDAIVFRTAPYSELSTYGWDTELAFEVDDLDYETHQGWSVVAVGRAHVVSDTDEVQRIRREWGPRPWAPGTRNLYVELVWRKLTGLRLGDYATIATPTSAAAEGPRAWPTGPSALSGLARTAHADGEGHVEC